MPTTQTLFWTALPRGRDGDTLRLSVHLAPRLRTDVGAPVPKLGTFPDMAEWPKRLAAMTWEVDLDGQAATAEVISPAPDQALYESVFPKDTFVRPHVFVDLSTNILRSFPVRDILGHLDELYTTVVSTSARDFPRIDQDPANPLTKLARELGLGWERKEKVGKVLDGQLKDEKFFKQKEGNHGFPSKAALDYFLTERFYRRPETREAYQPHDLALVPAPPEIPELDYHQVVAILASYPALLRRLGLVVDLAVRLPAGVADQGIVRVQPRWGLGPEAFHEELSHGTHYELRPKAFRARPRATSDLRDGMLRLEDERFVLYQVDLDGAAQKVIDLAQSLVGLQKPGVRSYTTPQEASLPALRSAGWTVARSGRAEAVHGALTRAQAMEQQAQAGQASELFADDLVRGYRLDVSEAGKPWRSLCRRLGRYEFLRSGEVLELKDEGYVKAGAVTSEDSPGAPDLYLHEALFGWEGWSLVAPRPGLVPTPEVDGSGQQAERLVRHEPKAVTDFQLETRFVPEPGTLPKLRFGSGYQLRARAVDLAGNSEGPDSGDFSHATQKTTYARMEPVPQPTLLLREIYTEGESMEHMVVRSNFNVSAEDYVNLDYVVDALAPLAHDYDPDNERHVAPPKATQMMCEQHGRFDAAFGGTESERQAAFFTACREEGTFLDRFIINLQTGVKDVPVPGIALWPPPATPDEWPKRGDGLAPGQVVLHTAEQALTPYLPDPMARGAAFHGLPQTPPGTQAIIWDWQGPWPELEPFRLRLEEGHGAPDATSEPGVLIVQLPKGERVTVRYSSALREDELSLLGMWRKLPPHLQAELARRASEGELWMLSPYRELTLVHAVQQPLEVPRLIPYDFTRQPDQTFCAFRGAVENHSHSTGRIDLEATWTEPVDLLGKPGPEVVQGSAHVTDFNVAWDEDQARLGPENILSPPDKPRGLVHGAKHEFGDTRHRRVDYYAVATTRYREYFAPEITSKPENISRTGPVRQLSIPSSARPLAPLLQYVVPTFGWTRTELDGGGRQSIRHGGGLRVYMDRPWYSSGDGELLGVVLKSDAGAPGEALAPFVTRWGRDPVWGTFTGPLIVLRPELGVLTPGTGTVTGTVTTGRVVRPVGPGRVGRIDLSDRLGDLLVQPGRVGGRFDTTVPAAGPFADAVHAASGLRLAELSNPTVSVAGHAVEYDPERKLWYSDILINAGASYSPFVRLALARYQPNSLAGLELSPVVMANYSQVFPNRTARATFETDQRVKLSLSGLAGFGRVAQKARLVIPGLVEPEHPPVWASRRIVARLERPSKQVPGDLSWTRVGGDVELDLEHISGTTTRWSGALDLPEVPEARGGQAIYRVVLEEWEILETDDDVAADKIKRFLPNAEFPIQKRIVYVENIRL